MTMSYNLPVMDSAAMENLGQRLFDVSTAGIVITLSGPLGAGKTTLVRGFLRGMGYQGTVKSPTYTLVEPYVINHRHAYHFDLYRLAEEQADEALENIGAREYFGTDAICLVEWPQRAATWLKMQDLNVNIEIIAPMRQVTIQAHTDRGKHALQKLAI